MNRTILFGIFFITTCSNDKVHVNRKIHDQMSISQNELNNIIRDINIMNQNKEKFRKTIETFYKNDEKQLNEMLKRYENENIQVERLCKLLNKSNISDEEKKEFDKLKDEISICLHWRLSAIHLFNYMQVL